MKYPSDVHAFLTESENRTERKSDEKIREFLDILVGILNDQYDRGKSGAPVRMPNWFDGWEETFGQKPDKETTLLFLKIGEAQRKAYEQGQRDAAMEAANHE